MGSTNNSSIDISTMSGKITKTSTGETPNLNSAFNAAKTGKSSHGSSNRKSFAERGLHALIFELLAS